MKAVVLCVVSAVLLLSTIVWTRAQSPADLPPGISAEEWIAITDSVGIVVTSTPTGNLFGQFAPPSIGTRRANGRLMARHNGQWLVFDQLGSTEPRLHPALE